MTYVMAWLPSTVCDKIIGLGVHYSSSLCMIKDLSSLPCETGAALAPSVMSEASEPRSQGLLPKNFFCTQQPLLSLPRSTYRKCYKMSRCFY